MTVEEIAEDLRSVLNESGIKPARQLTILNLVGKYSDAHTLQIAEKAVGEERKNWGDKNPIGGALNNVLSRIKTETGES